MCVWAYIDSGYQELPDPNQIFQDWMGARSGCDKDPGLNCSVGALNCLFCLEKVATGWWILAQTLQT